VILACALACKGKQAEIDGVADWHLGRTQKKEGYVCTPQKDGITFCSSQPQIMIAEQAAEVLLYFAGNEDTAPLVEIILAIDRCRPEAVALAFEKQLGAPHESSGTTRIWSGKSAVIIAQLPTPDDRCEISFVDPTDAKRIAELRGPPAEPAANPQ
jgi:hypothetical protein